MINYAIATPNVYQQFGTNYQNDLAAEIHAVALQVGWGFTTISGGYRYLWISPEGYQVYLDVTVGTVSVLGSDYYVTFLQLKSQYDPSNAGPVYQIQVTESLTRPLTVTRAIAAHPCGLAVWVPGQDPASAGTYFLGGIPYVGQATMGSCNSLTPAVSEAWFSFGDSGNTGLNMQPRVNIDIGSSHFKSNQTVCINGSIYLGSSYGDNWMTPMIARRSSMEPDSGVNPGYSGSSHPLWYGELELIYPPLVGAGMSTTWQLAGQIYNAAIKSAPYAKDTLSSWDNYSWINFTDDYFFGGLWLITDNNLKPGPTKVVPGNYAY